jgi:hypothetical protein
MNDDNTEGEFERMPKTADAKALEKQTVRVILHLNINVEFDMLVLFLMKI